MIRHEKEIKREDGTKYLLKVDVILHYSQDAEYNVEVYSKQPRKRKWEAVDIGIPEYKFRALSLQERKAHLQRNLLRFVSEDEIHTAKIELWQKLKPQL